MSSIMTSPKRKSPTGLGGNLRRFLKSALTLGILSANAVEASAAITVFAESDARIGITNETFSDGNPFPATATLPATAHGAIKTVQLNLKGVFHYYPSVDLGIAISRADLNAGTGVPSGVGNASYYHVDTPTITPHYVVVRKTPLFTSLDDTDGHEFHDFAAITKPVDLSFTDDGAVWLPKTPYLGQVIRSDGSLTTFFEGKKPAGSYQIYVHDFWSQIAGKYGEPYPEYISGWNLQFLVVTDVYYDLSANGQWSQNGDLKSWHEDSLAGDFLKRGWQNEPEYTAHFSADPGAGTTVTATGAVAFDVVFERTGYTIAGDLTLTNGSVVVLPEVSAIIAGTVNGDANGITKTGAGVLEIAPSGKLNAGNRTITLAGGTLEIAVGGTLSASRLDIQSDSRLHTPGSLGFAGDITVSGANSALQIDGTLTSGNILVQAGTLAVTGDLRTPKLTMTGGSYSPAGHRHTGDAALSGQLSLSRQSVLWIDLDDETHYDKLTVGSGGTLGGTAVINAQNAPQPTLGHSISPLLGTIPTGEFDRVIKVGRYPFVGYSYRGSGSFRSIVDFQNPELLAGASANAKSVAAAMQNAYLTADAPLAGKLEAIALNTPTLTEASGVLDRGIPTTGIALRKSAERSAGTVTGALENLTNGLHLGGFNPGQFWTTPLFGDSSFQYHGKMPTMLASTTPMSAIEKEADRELSLWANASGTTASADADPGQNIQKYRGTNLGATIGADLDLSEMGENSLHLGLLLGFHADDSSVAASGSTSTTTSTTYIPGVYVAGKAAEIEYDLTVAYGISSYKLDRTLPAVGGLSAATATANPSGTQLITRCGLARHWKTGDRAWFGPAASITHTRNTISDYTETGAPGANLTVDAQSYDSLVSNLAWQVSKQMDWDGVSIIPDANIGWSHEFHPDAHDIGVTSSLLGGANRYIVQNDKIGADYMTLGVGIAALLSTTTSARFGYDAQLLRDHANSTHTFSLSIKSIF